MVPVLMDVSGWTSAFMGRTRSAWERLDKNGVSQLGANAETRVTHQADEIGLAAEQSYVLLFAKAQLAQTMGHFRRRRETLDADGRARDNAAERTKERIGRATVLQRAT